MKGGKDMKKIYEFEEKEDKYVIMNSNEEVFIINKDNLKIDGNKFYEAFFNNYAIGDIIEIKKGKSIKKDDKLSNPIYDTLKNLITDIIEKIEDQKED